MANFCYKCTAELFGEEVAGRNDMVSGRGDDVLTIDLCEHCGYGEFDNRGWRVPHDNVCIHGFNRDSCMIVAHNNYPFHLAYVSNLNFHGVGEFIAQYPEGDASSDFIKDYTPTCNIWKNIERLLTP